MKILLLTYKFPPKHLSGLEMGADFMARELVLAGHEVHVLVTRRDKGQSFKSQQKGYTLWRLPVLPVPLLRSFFELFLASFFILCLSPDQLHGQALVPCGLLSGFWGKCLKIPSLVYLYGRDVTHPNQFLREVLGAQVLKWNNVVLAATEHCKENALKIVERKINIFYSGFAITEKQILDQPSTKISDRILFVGRLEKVKGLDVLLQALSEINGEWHLEVIGEGVKKTEWMALASELKIETQITWLGEKTNSEVLAHMSQAQVFVLPSLEEPYGVVLLEALSQGCHLVATKIGGIPEIINEDAKGEMIDAKNIQGFTKAIEAALKKPAHTKEFRKKIISEYSWKNKVAELQQYYGK